MRSELLANVRREFNEWCGCLSVDEVCANAALIRLIEELESTLLKASATSHSHRSFV